LSNAEIDPAARQLAEERRIEGRLALTPEQRAVYEQGIATRQGMFQQQYDPARQRREGIIQALLGAGGQRGGEFAAAARAGMAYDTTQRNAKIKEFDDLQKARTGLIDIDRGNVRAGIEGGLKGLETASAMQREGLGAASRIYGAELGSDTERYRTDVTSRDNMFKLGVEDRNKALDREIDRLKIDAQNRATNASRFATDTARAEANYTGALRGLQELERRLRDDFASQYGMLLAAAQSGKLDPAQKNALETAQLELQQAIRRARTEMAPVLQSAGSRLGMGSMAGFGPLQVEPKK
jgi:hypothetical protein